MRLSILTLALGFVSAAAARAEDFYVAPTGDDQSSGTLAAPFASLERAQMAAAPGDTVWIRGGEYKLSGTTRTTGASLTKSGTKGQPIRYFAYAGEIPTFDLFELKPQARITGLDVRADWIHVRGLEVRGVRQIVVGDSWGVRIRGDHNVIEHLHVHDNEAPGVFITSGADNLVLNCDSHHNYDPLEDGGNADGFGCHSTGEGNVLRGCRAWENSDDGFDLINAAGACTVERSWAFRNGFVPDTDTPAANGAGFKSGGYGYPPNTPASGAARHVIRFNLAFANRVIGFYANFHPGGIDFVHNTAFDNPANFDMRTPGTASSHTLRNNLAAGSGRAIINFEGGSDEYNSWTLPVTVGADDFMSLDHALAYSARASDGSLPHTLLAQLRPDSDLVDCGEDRGMSFVGIAPDLGAFELGASPTESPSEPREPDDTDAGTPVEPGAMSSAGSAGSPAASVPTPQAGAGSLATGTTATPVAGEASSTRADATTASVPTQQAASRSGCSCELAKAGPHKGGPWLLLLMLLSGAARRSLTQRSRRRLPWSGAR